MNTGELLYLEKESRNLDRADAELDNCKFSKNRGFDAVIIQLIAILEIKNCLFEENQSIGRGSVILSTSSSNLSLFINRTSFLNNSAIHGGVLNFQTNGKLMCESSLFENNFAYYGGVFIR